MNNLTQMLMSKTTIEQQQQQNLNLESLDKLKELEQTYSVKVKELEEIEDKFNQCVAIIPETDENAIRLTHEIQKLKDSLDSVSKEFTEVKNGLTEVQDKRKR